MLERFNYEAIQDLVTQESRKLKIKYTAIEPIMYVIMNQWRKHRHWDFFELSQRHRWLLTDPLPTTVCLYRCLERIKSNATQYFLVPVNRLEEKETRDDNTTKKEARLSGSIAESEGGAAVSADFDTEHSSFSTNQEAPSGL